MRFSWLLVALLPTGSLGGQCPTQPQEHDDAAWQCGLTEEKRLSQQLHGDGYSAVTYSELWSGQHCGFCGGPANDTLTRLVDSLRKKERECRKMVVVSAAFGKKYLWRFAYKHSRAQTLRRHFGDCFIRFVAKDELESFVMNRKSTVEVEVFGEHAQHFKDAIAERKAAGLHPHAWPDSLNILVPINMTELPFAAPRRNGKIFKIISHRLFPWAERILWIDAKLMLSETLTPMEYFDLTIHNTGACAAFMNLPGREGGDVAGQIKRIEAAAHKRAVTDNLDVAFQQVEAYQKEDGEVRLTMRLCSSVAFPCARYATALCCSALLYSALLYSTLLCSGLV
mmetsp:Transcript_15848/g.60362  ORF Transcript_15848/g.60362 Transcript_15848/m.60362 type:complete len:339 (-) Transcript_15848:1166-2182(-)